jgi:hypothetical protein
LVREILIRLWNKLGKDAGWDGSIFRRALVRVQGLIRSHEHAFRLIP